MYEFVVSACNKDILILDFLGVGSVDQKLNDLLDIYFDVHLLLSVLWFSLALITPECAESK